MVQRYLLPKIGTLLEKVVAGFIDQHLDDSPVFGMNSLTQLVTTLFVLDHE